MFFLAFPGFPEPIVHGEDYRPWSLATFLKTKVLSTSKVSEEAVQAGRCVPPVQSCAREAIPRLVFPMRVYSGSFPNCSLLSSTSPLSAMMCARSAPPWFRCCNGLELFTKLVYKQAPGWIVVSERKACFREKSLLGQRAILPG